MLPRRASRGSNCLCLVALTLLPRRASRRLASL